MLETRENERGKAWAIAARRGFMKIPLSSRFRSFLLEKNSNSLQKFGPTRVHKSPSFHHSAMTQALVCHMGASTLWSKIEMGGSSKVGRYEVELIRSVKVTCQYSENLRAHKNKIGSPNKKKTQTRNFTGMEVFLQKEPHNPTYEDFSAM